MKRYFLLCILFCVFLCGDYRLAAWEDPELQHECTSWMVFKDLTKNNTHILHKNRDSAARNVAVLLSPVSSPRKWIALGSKNTNAGINASGLAGAMNSGEPCPDPSNNKTKKGTPAQLQEILTHCDTAAQAVERLRKMVKAGDYCHGDKGSIFFFMDRKEGYICEFTPKVFTVQKYGQGYAVRANIWQNPGMRLHSRSTLKRYLDSSARAHSAYDGLNKILEKHGKIAPLQIFELSRHHRMPEHSPLKRSLCFKYTNSGSTLEIDRQYPDVLSTGYFAIGPVRNTVYVPIPVCAEKVLPGMADFSWGAASFQRLKKQGFALPLPEAYLKYEKDFTEKYNHAKARARTLLDHGKRAEAIKLLNDTAYSIWLEAEAVLKK